MNKKLLLIYPNFPLQNPAPMSIAILVSLLKQNSIDIEIFDTTYYPEGIDTDKEKEKNLNVKPFSYNGHELPSITNTVENDLRIKIKIFDPGLIGISLTEGTWQQGKRLLNVVSEFNIPVIAGGVFPTFSPETVLEHPAVKYVCIGEGEQAIVSLCSAYDDSKINTIDNLCFKDNGKIQRNKLAKPIDLDLLPMPDFSFFHPSRLLRPMAGKIYRTIPLETNRGCPYLCTYCNSPSLNKLYKERTGCNYFRKKSIGRVCQEIEFFIKKYNPEYFYILSDTFLVMTNDEFDEFCSFYSKIKLPFWIQSRVETLNEEKIRRLKQIGCHRMSLGVEHGNEYFRYNILNKYYKNSHMIKTAKLIKKYNIPFSVNNIIGFPGETRSLIFDTIELNRNIPADDYSIYAFTPFHGTPLYKTCLTEKIISNSFVSDTITNYSLNIPQLSSENIKGLLRCFILYVKMPKSRWNEIKRAENFNPEGNKIWEKLKEEYTLKYLTQ
jgi:anaerobic magnesium-protoporphyrin IX monomethyl ester cyclase